MELRGDKGGDRRQCGGGRKVRREDEGVVEESDEKDNKLRSESHSIISHLNDNKLIVPT